MSGLNVIPVNKVSLISEEDAHYLLHTPFSYEKQYSTYPEYHYATIAKVDAWAKKQEQALAHAARSWDTCISMLKQACRDFCARVEPDFEPLLQEVLLIESKWWVGFEPIWSNFFAFSSDYCTPKYISQRNHRLLQVRVEILQHPREWIEKLIMSFYEVYKAIPRSGTGIFLRELSGEEAVEYVGQVYKAISQGKLHIQELYQRAVGNFMYDKRGNRLAPAPELGLRNLEFIKNTPFYSRAQVKMAYDIPLKPRLEHQWIIAASGAGKTQLLQRMICDDIEHGRSVVVIDSQRDMIGELTRLKHNMEVVYIDPEDIEYPPGIALFDVTFGTGAEAEARETQVIELYEYMFSVFGAELTARQGSLFTYGLRLMFAIPKANIHTLVELFRGDKYQFKRYWENMDSVERDFFDREFFEKKYMANREQILAKLNKILENKTLRRIFSNTESKLDFSILLNRSPPAGRAGVALFINTSQEQLGENGCALFGRFLLALITNAIVGRSKMPKDQRRPVFLYVDEGRDYGNDDAFERIIYQCRKYKAGLIFCSQNIGQLSQKTVSALFTSSIKFVRAVKEPAETRKLAQSIRVDEDFLHDLDIKDRSHAEWACKIENQKTVKATVNFGYLESQPTITEQEYQKLREENRRKYCVSVFRGKPDGNNARGSTPQAPLDQPKPVGSGQSPEQSGRDDSIWD
jgi:hypothetical protein